jgi:DNA-binding response OmpR family regulator
MQIILFGTAPDNDRFISRALNAHECTRIQHTTELAGQHPHLLILQGTEFNPIAPALLWAKEHNIPVLLIAHAHQQALIIKARASGAQDYVLMPLLKSELVTRVTVLLHSTYPDYDHLQAQIIGEFAFNAQKLTVHCHKETVTLTQKEFALAQLLLRHIGHPLSRATIAEVIWDQASALPTRTIDTHISRVRTKLKLLPQYGYQLSPVYGFGYQLIDLHQQCAASTTRFV